MLIAVLLLGCVAAWASADGSDEPPYICETEGGTKLKPFLQENKLHLFFPCKYWALNNQTCGDYTISLEPKNMWFGKMYQLEQLFLTVYKGDEMYFGKSTNRKAVASLNHGGAKELFKAMDGTITNCDLFETTHDDKSVTVTAKDGSFAVSYTPWDPSNRATYGKATFSFKCNVPMTVKRTGQLCGLRTAELKKAVEEIGLKSKFFPVAFFNQTFSTFNKFDNDECKRSYEIYTSGKCTNNIERREWVMSNCMQILYHTKRTECISAYNCDPMATFRRCLRWGCARNFQATDASGKRQCKEVAEDVFFCPSLNKIGNLTDSIQAAECYNAFPTIDPPASEPDPFAEP